MLFLWFQCDIQLYFIMCSSTVVKLTKPLLFYVPIWSNHLTKILDHWNDGNCIMSWLVDLNIHFLYQWLIIFSFTDIDECLFANGGCEDQCLNFNGSFQCQCREDSFLENDGVSCRGKVNIKRKMTGFGEVEYLLRPSMNSLNHIGGHCQFWHRHLLLCPVVW